MVWKASEKEFREYEEKKKAEEKKPSTGQNIKLHGKPYTPPGKIPANQQAQRDLRARKRTEQDTFEKRHPTAHKVIQGLKKAGHAAKEAGNRYVSSREESHRRLETASREEKDRYSDSWISEPVWTNTNPTRRGKSKSKKGSSRSGGSSDYYSYSLTNTLTGASYGAGLGGGLGMWGSSLPKKSTNPAHKKKKKATTTRRRRY